MTNLSKFTVGNKYFVLGHSMSGKTIVCSARLEEVFAPDTNGYNCVIVSHGCRMKCSLSELHKTKQDALVAFN